MGFIHLLSLFAACHAAQEVTAPAGITTPATTPAPITDLEKLKAEKERKAAHEAQHLERQKEFEMERKRRQEEEEEKRKAALRKEQHLERQKEFEMERKRRAEEEEKRRAALRKEQHLERQKEFEMERKRRAEEEEERKAAHEAQHLENLEAEKIERKRREEEEDMKKQEENGDDGASSTHGRMLARKTTRSLVVKRVHKWMNNFNPVNLEPSALVYAVKHDDIFGDIKIVQWFFKLAVISVAVSISGVLVGGIPAQILGYLSEDINDPLPGYKILKYFFNSTYWPLMTFLSIADIYALVMVPDQRIPYLVMFIVMWAVNGTFIGVGHMGSKIIQLILSISFFLINGLVAWYNWYKVLFPTWTGWAAKHWPQ